MMDEIRSKITYLYHANLNYHMNTNKQSGILPTCVSRLVPDVQGCYNSMDVILVYLEIKKRFSHSSTK